MGNPARDRRQGLGLGLAIVRRIGDLLGHRVRYAQSLEKARPSASNYRLAPRNRASAGSGGYDLDQNGRGRLAVVVDDDAMVLDSLEAILIEWGYETLTATDTEQAVARPARWSPPGYCDCRLSAAGRPHGRGSYPCIRALFDQPVPGLILTGETNLEFQRMAAAHGLGIAHKPVTPSQLGRMLDQQLNAA